MKYIRLLLVATVVAASFGWSAAPALAAPPKGVKVDFQVGYDSYVQLGRINPVIIDLDNQSADKNLSGEIALRYNDVEYVTPLELPTPSSKRIFMYFPCDDSTPYLTCTIRTKTYTEEFDLNSYYKTSQPADTSIVVLTDQPGSLNVANQLDTVRLHRNLYETATSAIGNSKTFVSYFKLDEVDPNPKFFDRADVIVLADIDYRQVKPELAEALKACAAGGASVVFSLGLNGSAVSSSPLAQFCPLQTSGTIQLSDLGAFGRRYGISAAGAPATFAIGQVAPGAEVLDSAGNYPAMVRSHWGSGTVTALAFDFTQLPFKQNDRLASLFRDTVLSVPQNVEVRNWFVHPGPVSKLLQGLSEAKPMSPSFVLLFIAAYVALIGPLNFLVLRRLKRQTLIWGTIPLLILGFGYGGLETGRITRGSDNVTSTFEELHVYPHASYVPYQSVMLVFTAERTHYSLEVPDASAFLFADVPQATDDYRMLGNGAGAVQQFRGLTDSKLDLTAKPLVTTTQGKWTNKEFFYQGYAQLPLNVDSNITAIRAQHGVGAVSGKFTLDMPFDLKDCYLDTGGGPERVGDLAGKGTYDIAALKGVRLQDSPDEDYLFKARDEIATDQRAASSLGLDYRDEVLLVGFSDKLPVDAQFKRRHKEHALTMVVVHLPYTELANSTKGASQVRTLITGGQDFSLDHNNYRYDGNSDQQQLLFKSGGVLDLELQLLGSAQLATRFNVTVDAQLDRNQPVKSAASAITVLGWTGVGWRPLPLNTDTQELDGSLAGLIDANHVVKLRLVSQVENLRIKMPESTAYGGGAS